MPFFSIIIPVYNASATLRRCFDSIFRQSFRNFEVVAVDDGSTDDSQNICKEYAKRYDNFKTVTKTNGGVSSARNMGLDFASGEWITFVDSDDELRTCFLESFYNAISRVESEKGGGSLTTLFVGNVEVRDLKGGGSTILSNVSKISDIKSFYKSELYGSTINKAFSKEILTKLNLRFDETLKFSEDCLFVAGYSAHMDNVCFIHDIIYTFYFCNNYSEKYKGHINYTKEKELYKKIKSVNITCSQFLVDGLIMRLFQYLKSGLGDEDQTISEFVDIVGRDIKYVKGRKKMLLRALSRIKTKTVWKWVIRIHMAMS